MDKMASIVHSDSDCPEKIQAKVLVIVSTYNGERYLREQLDSLINQTGAELDILVRDDGSKDATVDILTEYDKQHENLSFYVGDNKGVVSSFNDLMQRPELDQYDLIAFCDQDDVWDYDKIQIAASYIGNDNAEPVVYCSNLMLVDSNLQQIAPMRKPVRKYTTHMSVVENIGTGCTQVFNRRAVELFRKGIGCRIEMHDYWMTLLCLFCGKVIYDDSPHIRYRQHDNNVVGAKRKRISNAIRNINTQSCKRKAMICDFIRTYDLDNYEKTLIPITNDTFIDRMKLFLSPKYIGIITSTTIGFKVRTLLGRLY